MSLEWSGPSLSLAAAVTSLCVSGQFRISGLLIQFSNYWASSLCLSVWMTLRWSHIWTPQIILLALSYGCHARQPNRSFPTDVILSSKFHSQFKSRLCKSHPHWWHFPVAVARDYSHLASRAYIMWRWLETLNHCTNQKYGTRLDFKACIDQLVNLTANPDFMRQILGFTAFNRIPWSRLWCSSWLYFLFIFPYQCARHINVLRLLQD